MKPKIPQARGLTLIELAIVTVVIGITAAVLAPLALSSLRAYDYTLGDVVVMDKLRYATERMAREIREANYSATTGFAFTRMGANYIEFTRTFFDANGNSTTSNVRICGNAPAGTNTVNLAYSSPSACIGTEPVLTDELGSLAFAYFDQNGVALPLAPLPLTTVRAVQITLTLTHNGKPYIQSTRIELKGYYK